jgi:hypothetical protein
MDKHAYCVECGRYVQLAGEACPNGHSDDSLRDVRSGALPAGVAARQEVESEKARASAGSATSAAPDKGETAGRVVGWLVVVVPALGLAVIAVAMTEPQFESMGMGIPSAWVASFVTVALTFGAALAWGWVKFARKRR